jgi:flagellar biosynthesis protein FlhG
MNDEKMSPFDILEVAPGAPRHEIDRAYELALLSYGEDSLASYSLYSPRERIAMIHRIEGAYRALTDPSAKEAENAGASGIAALLQEMEREKTPPEPERAVSPAAREPIEERSPAARARASLNRHKPLPAGPAVEPIDIAGPYDGPTLRRIRDARGLRLEEVAASTKIGTTTLRLIESNAYDRLPAKIYLRGYLLAYARCLRLDPGAVTTSYMEQAKIDPSANGHRA